MLPLGHIGIRSIEHGKGDRWTRLSREEQRTMMTLFCIFRSPLMMGGELRNNDEWTLSLLTNSDVLRLLHHSDGAHELSRGASSILWASRDEDGSLYLAFFNTGTHEAHLECALSSLGLSSQSSVQVRDLWEREDIGTMTGSVHCCVPCHGCRLFRLHLL